MSKNNTILNIAILLMINISFSQTPVWEWVKTSTGAAFNGSRSMATDSNGNIYTAGAFRSSTFSYGNESISNSNTPNTDNGFISKHNSLGEIVWLKNFNGNNEEGISEIKIDNNNNIYIIGTFNSPTLTIDTTTLTNLGNYDAFIAKFDENGNLIWAKSIAGNNIDVGTSLSIDNSGNVFVSGHYSSSSIVIDTITLNNSEASETVIDHDVFFAKFDSLGNVIWAKTAGGTLTDQIKSITTDTFGNLFISGFFGSPTISFGTTNLTNTNNYYDVFIAKYNSSGTFQWAKKAGGTNYDYARSLVTDNLGDLYITGYFESPTITFGTTTHTNLGYSNIFLAKYTSTGNVVWSKTAGNNDTNFTTSIAKDSNNNIYITGGFSSSITFGSQPQLTCQGYYDIFVAKYDSMGNPIWSKSNGGLEYEIGSKVHCIQNDEILLTGFSGSSTIIFDNNTINTTAGYHYISKLSQIPLSNPDFISNNVSIYPNPAKNDLIILSQDNIHNKKYQIVNPLGRIITESYLDNHSNSININFLQSGIYFLKIDYYEAIKFIKN